MVIELTVLFTVYRRQHQHDKTKRTYLCHSLLLSSLTAWHLQIKVERCRNPRQISSIVPAADGMWRQNCNVASYQRNQTPERVTFLPNTFAPCFIARGIFYLSLTQQAIYTLHKYSLDVWFDLFYLFCGYQQNYGDISLFVKYPLFSNIAQLSGSRSEVSCTIDRRDGNAIMPKSLEAKTGLLFGAQGEEPFSTIANLCILLFIFWSSKSA